jgi:hypothetical protein
MDIDRLTSPICRLLFIAAFGLLGLAVLERVVYAFGYTILRETFTAGRLLDLAAVALIFVIALLLRQIRDGLAAGGARPS